MSTKKYFLLILTLCSYLNGFSQMPKEKDKNTTLFSDMHWKIERSDMQTVKAEFDKFCRQNDFPSLVSNLKDGKYKGTTPEDDYGYRHEVTFEMKGGKMISIDYDEIHKDGHAKKNDKEYGGRMLESGTTPAIAYLNYESRMLEKQDYNKIDAVSGASYSLYRFKLAILYAMLNSKQLK